MEMELRSSWSSEQETSGDCVAAALGKNEAEKRETGLFPRHAHIFSAALKAG